MNSSQSETFKLQNHKSADRLHVRIIIPTEYKTMKADPEQKSTENNQAKADDESMPIEQYSDKVFKFPEALTFSELKYLNYAKMENSDIKAEPHKIQIYAGNCTEQEIMDYVNSFFKSKKGNPNFSEQELENSVKKFVNSKKKKS